MKRYVFRDVSRNFRSHSRFRYMISIVRKLGGVEPRECNFCGYEGLFHSADLPPIFDDICPRCESISRHRLVGLFLQRQPDLGLSGRVMHFAPQTEQELAKILKHRASRYETADITGVNCDLELNLESLDLPDNSLMLCVLNHVLEHVRHDRLALAELYRCLAPGGAAVITVPIIEAWPETYECEQIAEHGSDRDRHLHFCNPGHVRMYGADLRQRIRDAGFELETFTATPDDVIRYSLERGETVFVARKPRVASNANNPSTRGRSPAYARSSTRTTGLTATE